MYIRYKNGRGGSERRPVRLTCIITRSLSKQAYYISTNRQVNVYQMLRLPVIIPKQRSARQRETISGREDMFARSLACEVEQRIKAEIVYWRRSRRFIVLLHN
jgi:hypothetical protein